MIKTIKTNLNQINLNIFIFCFANSEHTHQTIGLNQMWLIWTLHGSLVMKQELSPPLNFSTCSCWGYREAKQWQGDSSPCNQSLGILNSYLMPNFPSIVKQTNKHWDNSEFVRVTTLSRSSVLQDSPRSILWFLQPNITPLIPGRTQWALTSLGLFLFVWPTLTSNAL